MTSPTQKAARATIMLTAANACLTLCGYITVIVLARGLGPKEYGIYGIIISVLLSVELVARLGVPQALSKLIAERQEQTPQLEGTGLTLTLLIYLVVFGAFWLASPAMAKLFQIPGGKDLFRLASVDIPFYGMYFMCSHILNGQRRFGIESMGISIYGIAKALGILALLYFGLSVRGALVVNILASIIGLLYLASHIPVRSFYPTFAFAGLVIRWAVPVGLFLLGSQVLFNLHLWCLKVVGRELPEETIGFYVAAVSVARLPNIISFVMMAVLIPSVSHALGTGDKELAARYVQGATRFLEILLLPGCFLIALKAGPVMELLYSSRYMAGARFLSILVFGIGLLYTFMTTLCAILIAGGLPAASAATALCLVPLGLCTGILFVMQGGAEGAALSAAITMAVGTLLAGILVRRSIGPVLLPSTLIRVGLATALMTIVGMHFDYRGLGLLVECALLLVFYLVLLGLLGELKREDLKMIASTVPRAPG